jgi:signal transduction histidine kinase
MRAFAAGDRNARAPEIGIQELRQIAEQFNEMSDRLARQHENQLAFLTSVAHDLRNPVGALKMSTSILDPASPLPDEGRLREILAVVHRQIDHLNRMIGDLLDAYHIESGRLELRLEEVDAGDMVRDAFELFRYFSKSHQLSMESPSVPVPVQCDPGRISQVLNNLLSNAIKYSPDGGDIVLGLQPVDGQVLIEVSDNGVGIAPEDLPVIFEPFRRTRFSSREIPGVGLGLHVVKRIVDAHRGHIEVESREGQGTTFKLWIPRRVATEHPEVRREKERIA